MLCCSIDDYFLQKIEHYCTRIIQFTIYESIIMKQINFYKKWQTGKYHEMYSECHKLHEKFTNILTNNFSKELNDIMKMFRVIKHYFTITINENIQVECHYNDIFAYDFDIYKIIINTNHFIFDIYFEYGEIKRFYIGFYYSSKLFNQLKLDDLCHHFGLSFFTYQAYVYDNCNTCESFINNLNDDDFHNDIFTRNVNIIANYITKNIDNMMKKNWIPDIHYLLPDHIQNKIKIFMLCNNKFTKDQKILKIPKYILYDIFGYVGNGYL